MPTFDIRFKNDYNANSRSNAYHVRLVRWRSHVSAWGGKPFGSGAGVVRDCAS